ncbi:hypothetical protein KBX26_02940 [Micromonospora sp. C97]|uniref:hypothetical protein n=1 Tax=Micromonospora sp. C97 TaxID=2824883 RepID=UPI001B365FD5|nr:hypothetical protein [Micromonospora sp. C97]MBQ1028964.1 hypothetical protein [Micromonospora sp. C97]
MNARTRTAAVLTLALSVSGCTVGRQPPRTVPSTTRALPAPADVAAPVPPPSRAGFSYGDPGEVCTRFTVALYSVDTRRDAGPGDAYDRAIRYASGTLAAQSPAARQDGRWATWTEHRAYVDTVVEPFVDVLQPLDTAIAARRRVRVTATPLGEDGWRGWTEHSLVDCTLRRGGPDGSGWRVAEYEIRQTGLR